jgi:hypothetical protein
MTDPIMLLSTYYHAGFIDHYIFIIYACEE